MDRHWGAGFLPSRHQSIRFGGSGDELVRYLSSHSFLNAKLRERTIQDISALNQLHLSEVHDPEIETRISQYEMAAQMQTSVPEVADLSGESAATLELYGDDSQKPGTYANSVLLARRLIERGVRFVQVFQGGWDNYSNLPKQHQD